MRNHQERSRFRQWRHFAALVVVMSVVSGCYMPMRYDAEIEIFRTGHYSFIFDGYLAKIELFDAINKGKIKVGSKEEREEIEKIRVDMARDANASEFAYLKKGYFRIHWERKGDMLVSKTAIFLRRSDHILGISYNKKTGRVAVTGRSLAKKSRQGLDKMGLGGTNGQIRVITDAPVVRHNATQVKKNRSRGPGFKTYTWKIGNIYAPTPSLIIALH